MNHNPDTYYQRSEVSNSDLTALKNILHPVPMSDEIRQRAFHFGTLVDALITEPERVNHYQRTVDDVVYSEEDFLHGKEMLRSLRTESKGPLSR